MKASENSSLVRLTVNLTPRAFAALELAQKLTGDTKTDTVNRALQFYAYAEQIRSANGDILAREPGQEQLSIIKFL